jgi:hypothetical protein
MSVRYWGQALMRSEFGGLYVVGRIRPRWYWFLRRLWLSAQLVGRRWEPGCSRLTFAIAWEVAAVALGPGPCEVHPNRYGVLTGYVRSAVGDH